MNMKKKDLMMNNRDSMLSTFFPDRFHRAFADLIDLMWNDKELDPNCVFDPLHTKSTLPKINLAETDSAYEVEIAVSGINKDELELEFKDSCLLIKADKAEESKTEAEDKRWLRREISSRSFRRTINFPIKIDSKAITSSYDETKGLVVCVLPKVKIEAPEPVRIKIN